MPSCNHCFATIATVTALVFSNIAPSTANTWMFIGIDSECDTDAGEVFLPQSSGTARDIQSCQQSCENADGCQSVSFSSVDGDCAHYSTACNNIKTKTNTFAMRLVQDSTTARSDTGSCSHAHTNTRANTKRRRHKSQLDKLAVPAIQ